MSDPVTHSRTNTVRIPDFDEFEAECARHAIGLGDLHQDEGGDVLLTALDGQDGAREYTFFNYDGWPYWLGDDTELRYRLQDMDGIACNLPTLDGEVIDNAPEAFADKPDVRCDVCGDPLNMHTCTEPYAPSFPLLLAPFLADGDVAIFQTVSYQKLASLDGTAVAVNNKGDEVFVSLDDIYTLAQPLGTRITKAYS